MNQGRYLIVGLGEIEELGINNLGSLALDYVQGIVWKEKETGWISQDGEVIFLKPTIEYKNSIMYWKDQTKTPPDNILIILENKEMTLGSIGLGEIDNNYQTLMLGTKDYLGDISMFDLDIISDAVFMFIQYGPDSVITMLNKK